MSKVAEALKLSPIFQLVLWGLLIAGILLLIDFYAYQAVRSATANLSQRWRTGLRWAYWGISIGYLVTLLGSMYFIFQSRMGGGNVTGQFLFGLFVLLYVPKLFVVAFMLGEDLYRLLRAAWTWGSLKLNPPAPAAIEPDILISRSQFLSRAALTVAAIPFAGTAYGITRGKYDYRVHTHVLRFPNLPSEFEGLRIVQLSDIHSGSFDNRRAVANGIAMANDQGPDLVLFTGDIVNNRAAEYEPWADVFGKLNVPKLGRFSTLGNHDYGDYTAWPSDVDKVRNLAHLKHLQAESGFTLLNNAHRVLERGTGRIALVGSENWGTGGFVKKGDLNAAVAGLPQDVPFKILMSHDPSHWRAEVLDHPAHFDLTLAGHTHGMQYGVEIPGIIKFSPVQWRYSEWAGTYNRGNQVLNVNRGFGFIGFPGRVGIWPEITVLELRRA